MPLSHRQNQTTSALRNQNAAVLLASRGCAVAGGSANRFGLACDAPCDPSIDTTHPAACMRSPSAVLSFLFCLSPRFSSFLARDPSKRPGLVLPNDMERGEEGCR
jgi:hypothetical protein